jgi:hypothetical protein
MERSNEGCVNNNFRFFFGNIQEGLIEQPVLDPSAGNIYLQLQQMSN